MQPMVIGLFGTCGDSRWREPFIAEYQRRGIPFFNPQVPDWKPELAVAEARHLVEDPIILFPVTSETYGTGSLAECGFSIIQALKLNERRDIGVLIDQRLDDRLLENSQLAKESMRGRKLVSEHLKKLRLDRVYIVDTLEQMLEVSLALYQAALLLEPFRRYNPHDS